MFSKKPLIALLAATAAVSASDIQPYAGV
jgi:hypothetical protein